MLGKIARQLRVTTRRSEMAWRYGYHLPQVLRYRLRAEAGQSSEVRRVIDELDREGVVQTSAEALLSSPESFQALRDEVVKIQRDRTADLVEARRQGNLGGLKSYSYEFFGGLQNASPIHREFACQPEFKQVADGYLGLGSRLRAADTWLTLVSNAEARQSQTWHRDPEDRYVVKVFALLSDVDDRSGPFHYARGSHMKGTDKRVKACAKYGLTDEEMNSLVPRKRWFIGTGGVGTIVFADTRGYHKGGLARERERLVFVGMFLAF